MSTSLSGTPEELHDRFFNLNTARDVADLLEVQYAKLVWHIYQSPRSLRYQTFLLPKKRGGFRQIMVPITPLKLIQRKLNQVLQSVYPAKDYVHGFVRGSDIVSNAKMHRRRRYVLNVDLANFFPSINFGRVRGMFMAVPYLRNAEVATVLAQICCFDNQLPQGAPSSPIVSNMICARLDSHLKRLARENHCYYTRYADDLTFSTRDRDFSPQLAVRQGGSVTLGVKLREAIQGNGFAVNEGKVRLQYRSDRQEVTGLTVNWKVNVRRTFVREIRAMLHAWEKHGYLDAQNDFFARNSLALPANGSPLFREVIRGKIHFLGYVRNKDQLYRNFRRKFNDLNHENIGRASTGAP